MLQKLLDKIRKNNLAKLPTVNKPKDADIYNIPNESLDVLFKDELEKVGGQVFICKNEQDLLVNLSQLFDQKKWQVPVTFSQEVAQVLDKAQINYFNDYEHFKNLDVGLNTCEALVAWTGSIIVSSAQRGGRQINVYAPELVILAHKEQIYKTLDEALDFVINKYKQKPSQISVITGPSKTADIEKTLVYGMHGARKVYVFIY